MENSEKTNHDIFTDGYLHGLNDVILSEQTPKGTERDYLLWWQGHHHGRLVRTTQLMNRSEELGL